MYCSDEQGYALRGRKRKTRAPTRSSLPADETNGTEADAAGVLLSLFALASGIELSKVEDCQCAMLTIAELLMFMMVQLKNLEV